MIERQILAQKKKEQQIKEFIYSYLNKASYSHTEIQRTPMGERIIIYSSRPGLVVGRRGSNILDATRILKEKFGLENPQIEVAEIENPSLNAQSVAKRIVTLFDRFGAKRFKSIGYRVLEDMMNAGARGAEIVIAGRGVPSTRAKRWRFSAGYLKKSGDISDTYINRGYATADLRSGTIGVSVSILHPDVKLPDQILIKEIDNGLKVEKVVEEKEEKKEIRKETEEKVEEKAKEKKKKVEKEIKKGKEAKEEKKTKEKKEKKK
jgi:small subunit ribosomal protein S3